MGLPTQCWTSPVGLVVSPNPIRLVSSYEPMDKGREAHLKGQGSRGVQQISPREWELEGSEEHSQDDTYRTTREMSPPTT